MTPKDHYEHFIARKAVYDYNAIFRYGCCYHFALILNERHGFALEFVPAERHDDDTPANPSPPGIGHCWAVHGSGRAIDINGMLPRDVIRSIYREGCQLPTCAIEPAELKASLGTRGYPPEMNDEAFALAKQILDSHMRFQDIGRLPEDFWDPACGK